jgi:hypothetical protein
VPAENAFSVTVYVPVSELIIVVKGRYDHPVIEGAYVSVA